ncbi:12818_t:CDS:10, partial [Entrophospora sp. SA101]
VNWRCEAELPNYIKFGSLSVICEGYDYPDDSYVLKDYSNYPDHKINSDDDKFIEEFFEYRNRSKLFSLSLSYPNNNDKSSTTSQNLPLKICWLSNSQIYALTFLISGICNRGDTATMKSTMFLTEGLKIVEQRINSNENGLSLQEIIKSKKFYINLKAYNIHNNNEQQWSYQSQPASQPASQSQQTTQTTQYTQQYHDQYPQHLQQTQIDNPSTGGSGRSNHHHQIYQPLPQLHSSLQTSLYQQPQPPTPQTATSAAVKKTTGRTTASATTSTISEAAAGGATTTTAAKETAGRTATSTAVKKTTGRTKTTRTTTASSKETAGGTKTANSNKRSKGSYLSEAAKKPITAESSTSHNNSNLTNGNNKPVAISSDQKRYLLAAIKCLEALLNYLESNVDNNNNDEHEKPLVELKTRFRLSQILFLFTENIHEAENHLQKGIQIAQTQDDFRELKFKMIDLRCDIFKSNNNSNSAKNLLKSSAIEAMENNMPPWYYHFQLKRANLHYSEKDFDGCMNVLRQVCSLADQRADVEMKACVLILIAQYAFTSQNYTLTQRSLDELQTVYFPSSLIQSSQAYNRFPISNRHLYLHFSLLYITYHMHTGNMKLAAERLSEVHHILDSNSLNDINVDGSTGETTIHISPVSESSLSLSYPNNNDKSSTTSQNLPLKICWLSNSQIYALTFLISGICNRGDTATMKSTMFLTEGLKIVEQRINSNENGLSLQEIIKSKKFYINLKAYMLQYLIDVYLLRSEFTEAEKTLAQLMNWSNIHNLWPQFHINIIIALGMINQFIGKPIIATEFYKAAEKIYTILKEIEQEDIFQTNNIDESLLESLKISTSLFNNQLKALTLSVLGTLFKVTQNDQAEKMLTSSYTLSKNARNNIGCLISGRLLEEIYQKQQKLSDHANQVTSNRKHEMDVCKFLSEWSMKSRVVFNLLDDNNNNGVGGNNVDGVVANVSNPSSNIYNNIPNGSHGNSSGGEHL